MMRLPQMMFLLKLMRITAVEIVLIGSDIDSSELTFLLDESSSDGSISISGSTATFTPDDNFNGTTTFTYLVTDGELTSSTSIVTIIVSPVNDAPVLSSIEDQSIDEDNDLVISLSANDVDGDGLTYSASVDGNSTSSVDGNILTVSPDADYNGSIVVDILVTDGDLSDSLSFTLVVNPINDVPTSDDVSSQVDEDNSVEIVLIGSDIDSSELTFLLDESSSDGSISISGSIATFTPDDNFNGTTTFTYLVTDGELTSSTSIVTIIVSPVNDAPVLSSIEDQSINEDNDLVISLSANDVDGDILEFYTVVIGDASAIIVDNILTVTPDLNTFGDVSVTVAATDGEFTDTQSFVLTVNSVNDLPFFVEIENQTILEDNSFTLEIEVFDDDHTDLDLTIIEAPFG